MTPPEKQAHAPSHRATHRPYASLLISLAVSFLVMYMIMYAMADRWGHVYFNLSNVYMTGLMAASMLPVMLLTMREMYQDSTRNALMWAASAVLLVGCWLMLRTEAGVGDRQFMRAMIPHHSAAIQMCRQSSLTAPPVLALCEAIVGSQEREIAEMEARLGKRD